MCSFISLSVPMIVGMVYSTLDRNWEKLFDMLVIRYLLIRLIRITIRCIHTITITIASLKSGNSKYRQIFAKNKSSCIACIQIDWEKLKIRQCPNGVRLIFALMDWITHTTYFYCCFCKVLTFFSNDLKAVQPN